MRSDARENLLKVFSEIVLDQHVTSTRICTCTGLSNGAVKDAIAMLKEMGAVFRVGARKNGRWLVANRLLASD